MIFKQLITKYIVLNFTFVGFNKHKIAGIYVLTQKRF